MHSAHKSIFKTSDFLLFLSLAFGALAEYRYPSSLDSIISPDTATILGLLLLSAAWTGIFLAKREFKHTSQKTGPGTPTTKLITSGIFSYSRNPIYVCVIMIHIAIGFIANSV